MKLVFRFCFSVGCPRIMMRMTPGTSTHPFPNTEKQPGTGLSWLPQSPRHQPPPCILLLLAIPAPADEAGEVQAPCQHLQEHLVLLDALHELPGEVPHRHGHQPWGTLYP